MLCYKRGALQRARKAVMTIDSTAAIAASVLDPLRARGVLCVGPCDKASPERIVEMAAERIAQQAKEIERLCEVNAKVLASVASAPGSGLRKRLRAAQEALLAGHGHGGGLSTSLTTYSNARTSL